MLWSCHCGMRQSTRKVSSMVRRGPSSAGAAACKEEALENTVVRLQRGPGLWGLHALPSRRDSAGCPCSPIVKKATMNGQLATSGSRRGCWGPDPATLWSSGSEWCVPDSREFCKAAVAVSVGQSEPESVRAHREVLLAGILHMYWCGRSERTTRCHRQDMAISRWLEAPGVVS